MATKKRKIRWRWVPGYEGLYKVSSHGKVKSYHKNWDGRVLKANPVQGGYLQVALTDDSGRWSVGVHQLVLLAFRGDPKPGQETRHLNGDPTDNRLKNLRWGTRKQNAQDKQRHGTQTRGEDAGRAVLSESDVEYVRETLSANPGKVTLKSLADELGVAESTINAVAKNKSWTHVGGPDCSNLPRCKGGPGASVSLDDAQTILNQYIEGDTQTDLATRWNVSQATVSFIVHRKGAYANLEGPSVKRRHKKGGPSKQLPDSTARKIRRLYQASRVWTMIKLAERFNTSQSTVNNIVNAARGYAHLGHEVTRPPSLDPEVVEQIRDRFANGELQREIADSLGLDQSTISRLVSASGER